MGQTKYNVISGFEVLEHVQTRATKLVKGLIRSGWENWSCSTWRKEASGEPCYYLPLPEGRLLREGVQALPPGNKWQDKKKWPSVAPGKV